MAGVAIKTDSWLSIVNSCRVGFAASVMVCRVVSIACFQISSFRSRLNSLAGENIDSGIVPDIVIPSDEMIEIQVTEDRKMTVKNYKDFYDIKKVGKLIKDWK